MAPGKARKSPRKERQAADVDKAVGGALPGKRSRQRPVDLTANSAGVAAAHHGDQPSAQEAPPMPREDRAG